LKEDNQLLQFRISCFGFLSNVHAEGWSEVLMSSPVEHALLASSAFDSSALGLAPAGRVWANLSAAALSEHAVGRGEALLTDLGAVAAYTRKRTGRSPKDKFIVRETPHADQIDWTSNQPMDPTAFGRLRDLVRAYLQNRELYVFDGFAGADPDPRLRLPLRVVTEKAWHSLFARCLFLRPTLEQLEDFVPEWTILHACDFHAESARDNTRSEVCVAISFEQKLVVACGTHYAGEIKKSVFTIMNFLLPQKGIFPMHCSANLGQGGDVALFFGLSGTGKTTLSADPERRLIGDDEHGWSETGIFNFEGGCYAKTIKLSAASEPQIWNAIRFGCVLENVPVDPLTRKPDFHSHEITENTRAAYPVDFIPGCELSGVGGHPKNIFFLTCDAFGVLPPLARLTPDQAGEYFLCGYTAKVAGTEAGVTEPTPEFSACFAKPFLPLPPKRYSTMLKEKLEMHNVPVWLVNTGWTGGPYGVGKRMSLAHTRALLRAVLTGGLKDVSFAPDPVFGLAIPATCPNVPESVLRPRDSWPDKSAYDKKAKELAERFKTEFKKYA
jgi:phosphoenolpyruvate carboxykinase (ATP)